MSTQQSQPLTETRSPGRTSSFADLFSLISANVQQAIEGKPEVVDLAVVCLLAEGHLLIEDIPGVGKTSLAKALARSVDGTFSRIQFTPDLLPSDIVGTSVWDRSTSTFEFRPGPVFASIVLGDELNRAAPKTQSALLEAMAERQVTVDGTSRRLGPPFMVVATQNPIEHKGTYPLPESQLDRFLMRLSIGYPAREAELAVLETHGGADPVELIRPVATASQIDAMATFVRQVHVAPSVRSYLVDVAHATRRHPDLDLGMSPRATLSLQRAARARAASLGRDYVVPDDVKALAVPVLAHRLVLGARPDMAGASAADVVRDCIDAVPIPR